MTKKKQNGLNETLKLKDFNAEKEKTTVIKGMPETDKEKIQHQVKNFIKANKRKDENEIKTFLGARMALDIQTQAPIKQGELFDILKKNDLTMAKKLWESNTLTTITKYGIDCSIMAQKLIIALCKFLYLQSSRNGRIHKGDLTGVRELVVSYVEGDLELSNKIKEENQERKVKMTKQGDVLHSAPTYILVKTTELAKEIKGGKRINGKDKDLVSRALLELDSLKFIYDSNGVKFWSKAISIEIGALTKNEPLLIKLYPIFGVLSKDYIEYPMDILKRISKLTKKIEMQLFNYLMIVMSWNLPSGDTFQIDKRDLLDRIAIAKRYKDHPKSLASDFTNSIQKIKEMGLINSYEETIHKDGVGTVCTFNLNRNWADGEKKISE